MRHKKIYRVWNRKIERKMRIMSRDCAGEKCQKAG